MGVWYLGSSLEDMEQVGWVYCIGVYYAAGSWMLYCSLICFLGGLKEG